MAGVPSIRRAGIAMLVALASWLNCGIAAARADEFTGTVIRVRDGDSLQLLTDAWQRIEVRLEAIDAPEKANAASPGQAYAERARTHLSRLAHRRHATFRHITMDRYGRHVGLLRVDTPAGPVDAGLWQIEAGMAWVYARYLSELPPELRESYVDAEARARAGRRGLWRDPKPTPPWEWRRRHPRRPRAADHSRGDGAGPDQRACGFIESNPPPALAAHPDWLVRVRIVSRAKHRSVQAFALSCSERSR